MIKKFVKAARELPIEGSRLLNGNYPDFVTAFGNKPLGRQVPVFMFHSVERRSLEAQLYFLQSNGYQTLTMAEFMAFMRGDHQPDRPSVLLTFDDGHKSWFEIAYPLLQSYGFNAVGFLVSHFIREQPENSPWLSWPEVFEMEQSGVMEFESHTTRHERIYVGPKVVDFFHPHFDQSSLRLSIPWVGQGADYNNRLRWGTPIYENSSRLLGRPRFIEDATVRQACVDFVEKAGGELFFSRSDWRHELARQYKSCSDVGFRYRYESEKEKREAVLSGLIEGRRVLGEKLGRPVRHLCYPWGIGSELAVALSREAGYVSNFWVVTDRRSNWSGNCPFYIPRVKDDYIFRLPGAGRHSLAKVFTMKLRRRSQKEHIY